MEQTECSETSAYKIQTPGNHTKVRIQYSEHFILCFAERASSYNLSQRPTWCAYFNTFITILYMYMFRAISCSSSGRQIVLIQRLVLSLTVSERLVQRCTGLSLTDSDDTRRCINTILPPEDEQDIARNMYMYRIVINVLKICASSCSLAKLKGTFVYSDWFYRNWCVQSMYLK
jgi:hypothetical protein